MLQASRGRCWRSILFYLAWSRSCCHVPLCTTTLAAEEAMLPRIRCCTLSSQSASLPGRMEAVVKSTCTNPHKVRVICYMPLCMQPIKFVPARPPTAPARKTSDHVGTHGLFLFLRGALHKHSGATFTCGVKT